jgi:hypothetical protein
MNLYRLELKRVCKTRMTAILLAIALVLAHPLESKDRAGYLLVIE